MTRVRYSVRGTARVTKGFYARVLTVGPAAFAVAVVLAVVPAGASAEGSSAVSWGDNIDSQLGSGYRSNPGEFYPVTVQAVSNVAQLAPGEWFTLARLADGTVRSWGGGNMAGQLGNGKHGTNRSENGHPWTVEGLNGESEALTGVTSVAAGGASALAIVGSEGYLAAWGSNQFGQLGQGELNPRIDKKGVPSMEGTASDVPILVREGPPGPTGEKAEPLKHVTKIAAGGGADFALQVTPDGEEVLWSWGRDGNGKLGLGPPEAPGTPAPEPCNTEVGQVGCMTSPHRVDLPEAVTNGHIESIVAGGMGVYVLLRNGEIWAWGNNGKGALGTDQIANGGKEQDSGVPVEVELARRNEGAKAVALAAGNEGAVAALSSGAVVGWGRDQQGQFGTTAPETCQKEPCMKTPTAIPGLSGIASVAEGSGFTLALNTEGRVFSLGRDKYGELGRAIGVQPGTYKRVLSTDEPAAVHEPGPVTELRASTVFAIALVAPGTTLPPQQLTLTEGEEALTPAWTFTDADYLVHSTRYVECPEPKEESEEEANEREGTGEEEPEKEPECKKKESSPVETLSESQQTFAFTGLSFLQPYEVVVRSYDGISEHEVTEVVEGKEVTKTVKEFLNEHLRFIWGTPLPSAPHVAGVEPSIGRLEGDTSVTISGTHLSEATGVSFGGTPASSFIVNAGGASITAVSPAHAAGVVDVTVTDAIGTSPASSADRFTYAAAPPVVTSVSPSAGPTAGGLPVTIHGENLGRATAVRFGSAEATGVMANAEGTTLTATAPAGAEGTVNVVVTTPEGSSVVDSGDRYTYEVAPTLKRLSVGSGPASGGTEVQITGTNFQPGATTVDFGSAPATNVTVESPTTLTVTSPATEIPADGYVDVTVTTPGGTSAIIGGDRFKPEPTVTSVSPNRGSTEGGYPVVVTGAALGQAGAEVKIRFGNITNIKIVECKSALTAEHEYECVVTVGKSKAATDEVRATVNGVNSPEQKGDPLVEFTYG